MASQGGIATASTTTAAANSRLAQMQMRFQQKQIQEREQRRIELIGGTVNAASETTLNASKTMSNGKVRQMFDERRRGAGFDRGNPLKPIPATTPTTTKTTTTTRATSKSSTVLNATTTKGGTTRSTVSNRSQQQPNQSSAASRRSLQQQQQNIVNDNRERRTSQHFDEVDHLDNGTFSSAFSTLSLGDGDVGDRNNNNKINVNSAGNDVITKRAKSSHSIKLNPVVTKKSPSLATRTTAKTPTPTAASRQVKSNSSSAASTTSSMSNTRTVKSPIKKPGVKMTSTVKLPPRIVPPPAGMATCKYCQRNFYQERLQKHEEVCKKMAVSKRKVFDASKHRVKGTDAEKYLRKQTRSNVNTVNNNNNSNNKTKTAYISAAAAIGATADLKQNNWRKKHEEFISAIRAAKKVQSHLAKGGKLSDLPPPVPSDNSDYVQCPHCMRRFNEAAASRHIPKCANMLHNKSKSQPKKR